MKSGVVEFGPEGLQIEDVVALAHGSARAVLSDAPEFRARVAKGAEILAARLEAGERVYGVTTGFGESCLNEVAAGDVAQLPINLVRFHGCGTGEFLDEEQSAAVLAVRLASLVAGWSAVRPVVLERLCAMINRRILPQIPSEGSVGASGDLTPLSYVAALLMGQREALVDGVACDAGAALDAADLEPLLLGPKESLAIMNGTSVMTALSCLVFERARKLSRLVAAITATASQVMRGNAAHFDARIYAAKPHPGQMAFARWVREDLEYVPDGGRFEGRIQDRYSIRCSPHVVGVLLDSLPWMRSWLETELNGANDNPLIDPDTGEALHGGNFYGGHACFVADGLKNAVANVADLLDRQLALMCAPSTSGGLPENLVGREGPDRFAHHGFKAMQIAASALTAEALKLTVPASVFSRSTECHNQDKVSMGTIAARDALRVMELTERVAAICLLAVCQAVDIREREAAPGESGCGARAVALRDAVRTRVPFNDADRRQDRDIVAVLELMHGGRLPVGDANFG
jgi:histidine ammonia-lyase